MVTVSLVPGATISGCAIFIASVPEEPELDGVDPLGVLVDVLTIDVTVGGNPTIGIAT
jgi:hypothetical protein